MGCTQVGTAHAHTLDLPPPAAASAAGLRYVSDDTPGLRRRRMGKGFVYLRSDGRTLRARAELSRIRSLAIPPAWTDVWICPSPKGHIQAVGRDARGRKQYRYHPRWREVRDEAKYGRMAAFGKALPLLRARTESDLARPHLPRDKVLAAVVRLLERTLIRVGNEEYARANRSFGLTTLRSRHVDVEGVRIRFQFRGKSGKRHEVGLEDRHLSRIIRQCQELPGQELFQYLDERGRRRSIRSEDVNRYLRAVTGQPFTAKDCRTWGGTVRAAFALAACEPCPSLTKARKNVLRAIEEVSRRLGNTVAICRRCYVHPAVIDSYLEGTLQQALGRRPRPAGRPVNGLGAHESAVLRMLERRLAQGPPNDGDRLRKGLKASLAMVRPPRRNRTRPASRAAETTRRRGSSSVPHASPPDPAGSWRGRERRAHVPRVPFPSVSGPRG